MLVAGLLWLCGWAGRAQDSGVVYFLVGERPDLPTGYNRRNDAYVLPIPKSLTNDLLHARSLIAGVFDRATVIARVHAGADGINHNLAVPDMPPWSWHVEFLSFGGIVLEAGGHPSLVERNPNGWERIAFDLYTVVRELGERPLEVTVRPEGQGVRLNWWTPVPNQVFIVEATTSQTVPNWQPLPNVAWPIATRQWTVAHAPPGTHYRVTAADDRPVYFLVAELPETPAKERRHDAYVVGIPQSRTVELQHARNVVAGRTRGNRIVLAEVQAGADGLNHNLLDPDLPAWNWRVAGFQAFIDHAPSEMDGSPSGVALDPAAWAGGRIAFAGYTVVRELGVEPVLATAQTDPVGIKLRWWSPATEAQFTVEFTTSLTKPEWQPLPGGTWPSTVRDWTISDPPAGTYYRVTVGDAAP